jgi:hypothetical protein
MENPPEQKPQPDKEPKFDWDKFMNLPEVRQAIRRVPDIVKDHLSIKERTQNRESKRSLIMTVTLFIIGFSTVIVLTLTHGISSEATAFLLGVLLTGVISVIKGFTGGWED